MKTLLFLLTFTFFAQLAPAQTKQDAADLHRDLETYRRATLTLLYDSLVYFMPPPMFAIAPKEMLIEQIRQAFESELLRMSVDTMTYLDPAPDLIKAGEHLCAVVRYDGIMSMIFTDQSDTAQVEMLTRLMKKHFGEENAEEIRHGQLKIKTLNKRMIAIKSPGYDSWKFIEDKRSEAGDQAKLVQDIVDQVLPKEVLEATRQ